MINLFRSFRLNTISKNRFGKYILYAIGEIILVVIGILIALQINNWNEHRIENRELKGYLNTIAKNVELDLISLDQTLQRRKETFRLASDILNAIHSDSLQKIPDSVIVKGLSYAFVERFTKFNDNGLETLKSSGYLGKLNNTVFEERINSYYTMVNEIIDREKSLNVFVEAMEVEASIGGFMKNLVKFRFYPETGNSEDLRAMLVHPAVESVLYRMTAGFQLRDNFYPLTIQRGQELVDIIHDQTNASLL